MDYKNMIGDGKTPNYYWVFQYDEKFKREGDETIPIQEAIETKNSLLGKFKTYREALKCIDDKAYLPHIVIEDRLSGQVFESICYICPCCGKEEYETYNDIRFTKETMEKRGFKFK